MTTKYDYFINVQLNMDTKKYMLTQINRMRKDSDRLASTGRQPVYHFKLVGKLCTVYICNMDATLTHDTAIKIATAFVNGDTFVYDFESGQWSKSKPLAVKEPTVY